MIFFFSSQLYHNHIYIYWLQITVMLHIPKNGSANSPPTSAADPPSGAHACRKGGTISCPSKSRQKKWRKLVHVHAIEAFYYTILLHNSRPLRIFLWGIWGSIGIYKSDLLFEIEFSSRLHIRSCNQKVLQSLRDNPFVQWPNLFTVV